ncbi:hypothetical protein [Acinetobacter sp. AS167]|uniref:hypothetical protein n=1 Tax=Acinetobacter sp. AS167 TaxID=3127884 RepID=UPI0030174C73
MKNSTFIHEILAIYGYLILVDVVLYAIIFFFKLDITLTTNLLIWSATLFAPLALLLTYNGWRSQKASDVIAAESKVFYNYLHDNHHNIKAIIDSWGKVEAKNDYHVEKIKIRYAENLQYLNLYYGLLQHISDDESIYKIEVYINDLELIFNNKNISFEDPKILSQLKSLNIVSLELQKIVMNYILHFQNIKL